jgi:hypothetical protein
MILIAGEAYRVTGLQGEDLTVDFFRALSELRFEIKHFEREKS